MIRSPPLDEALSEDPEFGAAWAARAGLLVQQTDKAYAEEAAKSYRAGAAARLNDRERAHLEAARAWLEERYNESAVSLARIAQETRVICWRCSSRTRVVSTSACNRNYAIGRCRHCALSSAATTATGRCSEWPRSAWKKCGDFARAEAMGREAVEIDPRDEGGACGGARQRNARRSRSWDSVARRQCTALGPLESGFAYHNWWHLALLHLDTGDVRQVLRL